MAHEIINPYIQSLKDVAKQYIENVYCILDRVMSITIRQFGEQNISVNDQTHAFAVKCDKYNVLITPKLMSESVDISIINNDPKNIARIELNRNGPIDEIYSKFDNRDLRNEIKQYFNKLSEINIDQPVVSDTNHFGE